MILRVSTLAIALLVTQVLTAQYVFKRNDTVQVIKNTNIQQYAWGGGINFSQYSNIDLNFDGKKDLFVFDRTGNRILCFINTATTPGQTAWTFDPGMCYKFPPMENWALLRDYNGDGKEDIFTSFNGSAKVYLNTSNPTDGLQFQLVKSQLLSFYTVSLLGLFISPADIPAIDDIDGDGDLDILTFSLVGSCVEYHQNQSMETYGNADSLKFILKTDNWGLFTENINNNNVTFNDSCDKPDPQGPELLIAPDTYVSNPVHDMPDEDGDGTYPNLRHQGSTVATLDLEGDGDKDLFLGDVSFTNVSMLTNSGSAQYALMDAVDLSFPGYDTPVDIQLFPGTYFVDINNDTRPDMICTPNTGLNGENTLGVSLYYNIGSAPQNTFDFIRKEFIQGDMVDVGENALPTLFDYNNDGLQDLVIANYGYYQNGGIYRGGLSLYKNIGTPTIPKFKFMDRDWGSLSNQNINFMAPSFGDLDGDGKKDLVCGDRTGNLHFFKNIAPTNDTVVFTLMPTALSTIDVGGYSSPQLYDLNKDGLLDLIVGEKNGNLNYFPNTGTANNFIFATLPLTDNLGDIDIIDQTVSNFGYSMPCLFDSAGVTHLVVGAQRGTLFHYTNIDGNLTGAFTMQDSTFTTLTRQGTYAAPTMGDINNDGYIDAITGVATGGVHLYLGQNPLTSSVEENVTPSDISIYPNPANGMAFITNTKVKPGEKQVLTVYDLTGRVIMSENMTGNQHQLNISTLTKGMYLVTMQNAKGMVTKRLMVY